MINLRDAHKILLEANGDPSALADKQEMIELMKDIDAAGAEVLASVDDDELYTAGVLMLSTIAVGLMEEGEMEMAMRLLMNKDASLLIIAACMRLSLGIRDIEGWK